MDSLTATVGLSSAPLLGFPDRDSRCLDTQGTSRGSQDPCGTVYGDYTGEGGKEMSTKGIDYGFEYRIFSLFSSGKHLVSLVG